MVRLKSKSKQTNLLTALNAVAADFEQTRWKFDSVQLHRRIKQLLQSII